MKKENTTKSKRVRRNNKKSVSKLKNKPKRRTKRQLARMLVQDTKYKRALLAKEI